MLKDSDRSGELESHLSQWCGVRGFAPREKFASFKKMLCAKKKKKKSNAVKTQLLKWTCQAWSCVPALKKCAYTGPIGLHSH